MKSSELKPLPKAIKSDLEQINDLLKNALYHTQSNLPPTKRLEIIKTELIEALKKLPVNNYEFISKYC